MNVKIPDYIAKYDSLQNTPFYDWQDYLFKNSITQDYNIGIRGGTKTTKYSMSAAYTDQSGLVENSGFDRFTIRSRVDQNIGKRAKTGVNINKDGKLTFEDFSGWCAFRWL